MRDLKKDWCFKTYSARDDEAYHEFMTEVDDHRIKVNRLSTMRSSNKDTRFSERLHA